MSTKDVNLLHVIYIFKTIRMVAFFAGKNISNLRKYQRYFSKCITKNLAKNDFFLDLKKINIGTTHQNNFFLTTSKNTCMACY